MKRCIFALGVLIASSVAFAVDLDKPWGRWNASGATDQVFAYGAWFYTRLVDLSGNGNDLHLDYNIQPSSAAKTDRRGQQSLYCDGMSDADLEGTAPAFADFTVSFWINRTKMQPHYSTSDTFCLINGLNGLSVWGERDSDTYTVKLDGADTGIRIRLASGNARDWRHVVLTVGDGKVAAYLDNNLMGEADCPDHVGAAGKFFLFGSSDSNRDAFIGYIDDIRIYGAAFDADDVEALFLDSNQPRLMAYWPCERVDEADGLRTTTNLVDATRPLELGAGVSLVTHPDGERALSFSDSAEANQCYAHTPTARGLMKESRNDLTFMMRCRKSKALTANPGVLDFYKDGIGSYYFYAYSNPDWDYLVTYVLGPRMEYPCMATADQWCHFAWTIEYTWRKKDDDDLERFRRTRTYRNGELVTTSDWVSDEADRYYTGFPVGSQDIYVGNSHSMNAPFRGEISDVRIYQGHVSSEFVREVYRGPATVQAGADFTVCGAAAKLQGEVSPHAARPSASGFAGECRWSQVSGPADATFLNDRAPVTSVTLPEVGDYVFRLSNTAGDVTVCDDVRVIRAASRENVPPTVACGTKDVAGLFAVVAATATDGDGDVVRLRWSKVAGPGGVWFSSESAAEPVVTFSAPGDYTLACTASDGQDETTATMGLSVSGTTVEAQLKTDLLAYWPCDFAMAEDGTWKYPVDEVGARQLKPQNCTLSTGAGYGLGVDGTYGIRCADALTAYYQPSPDLLHSEGKIQMSGKDVPQEEWKTFSCWMYHDGSYLTPLNVCALYSVVSYQMFLYLPNLGGVPCFRICQCDAVSTADIFSTFTGPAENLTNRWVHVVFQANQHKTADHEVWVNGRKLAVQTMDLRLGRYVEKGACIGGNGYEYRKYAPESYNYDVDPDNTSIKYPFPGTLDEIRVYKRHLSESEIRYLYEHPTATREELPPSVTVPLSSIRMRTRETSDPVTAAAFVADSARALTYSWQVVAGDASKLSFSDPNSLRTSITAKTGSAGDYALQLMVFDGVRTTYSEPIEVTVEKNGAVIIFR